MTIAQTLFWLALVLVLFGFAIWRDSQPRQNGRVHWFSWKPVLMIALVVAIVLLVHILNELGIETHQRGGRF
ncbi:MAG: hypothetical protein COA47_08720 [Robiginitomaculum sp.]|nr:MAG: hypothetical protein COA47_08720 [Robiginitomaculum sp.]